MDIEVLGILSIIFGSTVVVPIVSTFIFKNKKHKREIELEKMKLQKEMLQLEIEKQNGQILLLQEENKKSERIINEDWNEINIPK